MSKYSRKPLILPLFTIIIIFIIFSVLFFSAQSILIELPSQPEIHPSINRNGSSFSGFIDVRIPFNITNRSPGNLKNLKITAIISVVSIENIGLFPDTTIINISQEIQKINSKEFAQITLVVNVTSWIPLLAIMDAYLVLDINVRVIYQLGPFNFPINLFSRMQNRWKAPFAS